MTRALQRADEPDVLHRFFRVAAKQTAGNIIELTRGLEIRSILDIGAGTGAVLERLDEAGFGERYYAVEPSEPLYRFMVQRGSISRLAAAEPVTLSESSFVDRTFDLAILSHVLGHVEAPSVLLAQALGVARFAVMMLALEGSAAGNARAWALSCLAGRPRRNNPSGSIHFFSLASAGSLVQFAGGEVVRSSIQAPAELMSYAARRETGTRGVYARMVWALYRRLGERVWSRLYHAHYAALVRRRRPLLARDRTAWPPLYYYG